MRVNFFLSIFISSSILSMLYCQKHVPKIQVYIESLCPDCMDFLSKSFKDFIEKVSKPNLADIELIPYGNAEESYNETTNRWDFECQHGEKECYGNLIETCLIQNFGRVNSYKQILCLEENIDKYESNFDATLIYCLNDNQEQLEEIRQCVNSDLGNYYQHQMAQKTEEHDYVPWVMVDGEHDVAAEKIITKSLIDYVCGDDKTKCYSE